MFEVLSWLEGLVLQPISKCRTLFFSFLAAVYFSNLLPLLQIFPVVSRSSKQAGKGCLKELGDSVVYRGLQCWGFFGSLMCYNGCFSMIPHNLLLTKFKHVAVQELGLVEFSL